MKLLVKRLDPRAKLPTRATPGSAGLDVYALDMGWVEPGKRVAVRTGIAIEMSDLRFEHTGLGGYVALACPRSGLAVKHGVTILNAPGVIDQDYRGELHAIVVNHGDADFEWNAGDRIMQLVIVPVAWVSAIIEFDQLSSTDRGAGGLGSTGR